MCQHHTQDKYSSYANHSLAPQQNDANINIWESRPSASIMIAYVQESEVCTTQFFMYSYDPIVHRYTPFVFDSELLLLLVCGCCYSRPDASTQQKSSMYICLLQFVLGFQQYVDAPLVIRENKHPTRKNRNKKKCHLIKTFKPANFVPSTNQPKSLWSACQAFLWSPGAKHLVYIRGLRLETGKFKAMQQHQHVNVTVSMYQGIV